MDGWTDEEIIEKTLRLATALAVRNPQGVALAFWVLMRDMRDKIMTGNELKAVREALAGVRARLQQDFGEECYWSELAAAFDAAASQATDVRQFRVVADEPVAPRQIERRKRWEWTGPTYIESGKELDDEAPGP